MSRGDSKKVTNAGLANSATDMANATASLAGANKSIGDYANRLTGFINANPYKEGGQFQQDQSQISASAADTGSNAIRDRLARDAQTSGENTGGYANNVAEAQRQATRDQATQIAQSDASRIGAKSAYDKAGLDASALPADLQARLYGTSIGGANGALNTAADSAKTPGFLDSLFPAIIGGAAQVGAGFTPKGCWIAEAIYGTDDIRTHLVREWLNVEFALRPIGKVVMGFYFRFGQKIAKVVKKSRILSSVLKPLFDCALSHAVAWKASK